MAKTWPEPVRLVSVAVPVPFLDVLTYQVPDGVAPPPRGARVVVPLGKRVVTGIVVDPAATLEAGQTSADKIKNILEVLDEDAFLPGPVVDLALWVAEYYACGAGDALAAAVPSTQAHKTIRLATLTAQGHDEQIALRGRQKEAVDVLRGAPDGVPVPGLNERGISTDVLQRLAAKGLVAFRHQRIERDPFASGVATTTLEPSLDRVLTGEQSRALDALAAAAATEQFSVFLLQGVTGSGKTEVYLRLADFVLRSGRSVLVLVPEIALTPAVASAFRDAFGDRVAVQHSGLSDGERSDQWYRIRRGEVSVVVGTRSAVFAPLEKLGLIIVDEEHDTSFKQEETPRYHGRDVAVVRGRNEGALVVLGSATPSLESSQNAASARYTRLVMERRVQDRPLASVSVVDMRQEYAEHGPDVIFSGALKNAIATRLEAGQQSLILLNRRGLATAVFCRQCGGTIECPNCSVSLIASASREGAGGRSPSRPMPLLQLRDARAQGVSGVQGTVSRAARIRHRKSRPRNLNPVARGSRGTARSRHGASQRGSGRYSSIDGHRQHRCPCRHADDRQGARFSPRDACRGRVGRRRTRSGRFPRRRAHVSAAHAGGGACRERCRARRSDRADDLSASLQHRARLPARTTRRSSPRSSAIARRCGIRR